MLHNSWNEPGGNGTGAVSGLGIDVRDFGSVLGSNFRDTLDRAIRCAYAESGAPENGNSGVTRVVLPGGPKYSMGDKTLVFPGSGPKYTPGLASLAGTGSAVLEWTNTVQGPWISTGSETPGGAATDATLMQTFQDLELRCEGGVSKYGGIKSRNGFMQRFSDVLVRGLSTTDQPWDAGIGFDFRNAVGGYTNHQHLRLERCVSAYNEIGYWFGETLWACTAIDLHANGCSVIGAMYEGGAVVTWVGGNTQCGAMATNNPHWNAGTQQAVHCSGATVTAGLPSGVGASMGSASGQFTVMTGMSGLLGYSVLHNATHKGLWLETRRTSNPWANTDRYSGLYRIHEVISDSSCVIRKGSNHSPLASGLTWQVRGGGGGYNLTLGGIYHEGGAYALASLGPDLGTSSRVDVHGSEANNCEVVVESTGMSGQIDARRVWAPGGKTAILRRTSNFTTDARINSVDMDSYSRPGVQAAYVSSGTDGRATRVWDAAPRASRYNSALRERGFVFACDARQSATIGRASLNVSTWSDFIGSTSGTRINSGISPQYVAADAASGTPAIRITGANAANLVGALQWNLASLFTSGQAVEPTLIVIGRLLDTTPSTSQRLCRLVSGVTFSMDVHWNDTNTPGAANSVGLYSTQIGARTTSSLFTADALPHVMVAAAHCGGRSGLGGGSDVVPFNVAEFAPGFAPFGFTGGASCSLSAGEFVTAGTTGDLILYHLAVAPFGITDEERAYFVDLAKNEFNIAEVS